MKNLLSVGQDKKYLDVDRKRGSHLPTQSVTNLLGLNPMTNTKNRNMAKKSMMSQNDKRPDPILDEMSIISATNNNYPESMMEIEKISYQGHEE